MTTYDELQMHLNELYDRYRYQPKIVHLRYDTYVDLESRLYSHPDNDLRLINETTGDQIDVLVDGNVHGTTGPEWFEPGYLIIDPSYLRKCGRGWEDRYAT